jgi:hypothetical protein
MSLPGRISPRLAAAAVLVALAALTAGTRLSDAAFTAQKSNPNNQFTAAPSFERMRVASGSYTGNGIDNRNIAVAFQPDLVIVKGNVAQTAVVKSSTMSGDSSKPLGGAVANTTNMIQALQATGFQVGTNARVNSNATVYSWVAISKAQGTISVSSYTGNGAATRTITGLGYSPEAVMVFGATAVAPTLRLSGMTSGFAFDTGTGIANSVTALGADGFTVGNSTSTNTNGVAYHYVSWNEVPGLVKSGSYTGNGVANRNLTGVGFTPALALVRSSSTTTSRAGVWRPSALTTGSLRFNAAANDSNAITALQADGFQLGANTDANANANAYAYLALEDESP